MGQFPEAQAWYEMNTPRKINVGPSSKKLKIAIVYSRSPLPMRRADQLTVAHLIEFLSARGHEVDLYAVNAGGRRDDAETAWLNERCRNVYFYEHSVGAIISGLSKVLFRKIPIQVGLFTHGDQARDIRAAAKGGKYDIVYTYYFRSAEVTKDLGRRSGGSSAVNYLAMQLSQSLNSRRIYENAPNLFNKILYGIETKLVSRYESHIWQKFDKCVLIGPADVAEVVSLCKRFKVPEINNYIYGAHGTDLERFRPKADVLTRPNHLVFSGVMRTPTNVQAVQWFVREVWPAVLAEIPSATLSIVGREPTAEVQALSGHAGIEVTGTVPDTATKIAEASVCINPMQAGGGMQNKLIEYLASGKPIVATSVANEGVKALDGEHLVIRDCPADFATAVVSLLRDKARSDTLAAAGRKFVESNWSWEAHFLKLEEDFINASCGLNGGGVSTA